MAKKKRRTITLSASATYALGERPLRAKLLRPFVGRYQRMRREILVKNARDFLIASRLRRLFDRLSKQNVSEQAVVELPIGGLWRPFRVEHHPTGTLRGENHGSYGGNSYSGHLSGTVTPDFVDSSVTIFLENDEGATLRAIVPSARTAREMLSKAIALWVVRADRESAGYQGARTHVGRVLHRFSMHGHWMEPLMHPHAIDTIDASCGKSLSDRPAVRIFGNVVRDGIALVSGMEVNGTMRTFVPTSFFQSLTTAVGRFVPSYASDMALPNSP